MLSQFQPCDLVAVYFVRTIGKAQSSCLSKRVCQAKVFGNRTTAMHLHRPIDHL